MLGGQRERPATIQDGFRILAAVEISLFALLWVTFGLGAFAWVWAQEVRHDRRMDLIRRGEVEPVTLHILAVYRDEKRATWLLEIGTGQPGAVEWRETASVEDLPVGAPVEAYPFPDGYFIPRFYNHVRWGKFVFLALGLLPFVVIGIARSVKRVDRAGPVVHCS